MVFPPTRLSSSIALTLVLSLAAACKAQGSSDGSMRDAGGTSSTTGAAGMAGTTGENLETTDTSFLVAPVQLPWVPHTDDTSCEHAAVEMSCTDGWCRIPAGCFVAGSPPDEPGRGMRNEELTTVHLTRSFEIGQYEVTRAEWAKAGWSLPMGRDEAMAWEVCFDATCPMTRVSLFGAMAYANWLSEQRGLDTCYRLNDCKGDSEYSISCASVTVNAASVYECDGYRLPTEVEWEYAARAGARTAFFAGPVSPAVADDIGNCVQEPALDDWAYGAKT